MARLGELSPAASVAIGILVGLASTSIQSIGLTLQRKSHILEDDKEDELIRRPPYRRRRWQLGMLMFIISNVVGSTIQITTLPLPVLSTLQASGLVFNTTCASLILGEPFTRWSFGGTALVAGGAVLIALYGALPEPSHNLNQLLTLLGRPQFIAWMICTGLLIVSILAVAFLTLRLSPSRRHTPRMRIIRGICYGSVSGVLSAHSLLVAKSAVELIVRTVIDGANQFNRWESWLILLSLAFFALTQLYFLHRGLKLVSTSVLYPLVFCIYNIIAILDGLIYFHQADRLPPLHAGLIALGTVILLSGVLALSWRLHDDHGAAPPSDAHTLLTPGMGMVEDTTTEDSDTETATTTSATATDDEEAVIESEERTPLLSKKPSFKPPLSNGSSLTVTRQRPKRMLSDQMEPWRAMDGEPEADQAAPEPPFRRRSSGQSVPSRVLKDDDDVNLGDDEGPMKSTGQGVRRSRTVVGTGDTIGDRKKVHGREQRRRSTNHHRTASTPLFLRSSTDTGSRTTRRRYRRREGSLAGWVSSWWKGEGAGEGTGAVGSSEGDAHHDRHVHG